MLHTQESKMELKEIYSLIEQIGCLTFSTLTEKGEIHSRIAHFNGYDEDGFYLRTMVTKPYYRQLMKSGQLTVCGMTDARILDHNEDGSTVFPPSFFLRLIGKVKHVPQEVIREKAKTNTMLVTAVQDMERYPAMADANFVMHAAKGEIFDVDFEMVNRDHKLYRQRFSFGGVTYNEPGPTITDRCMSCGACMDACTFKAIEEGEPYKIIRSRCDDCGDCRLACEFEAIDESEEF